MSIVFLLRNITSPISFDVLPDRLSSIIFFSLSASLLPVESIFVGVESSMLYEAGVAGHFVCHLKLDGSQPDFDVDLDFHEDEIANLLFWIQSVANGKVKKIINRSLEASPLKRFELALYGSGILETHNKNLY